MDRYMDIRILPDPEFPAPQLMNALFSKLHRALVRLQSTEIGVSFPAVDESAPSLGPVMRIHGSEPAFARLMAEPWLNGMRDHITIGAVSSPPPSHGYRQVRRIQVKSSPERIRRRQMKRHGWTEEEARARIPSSLKQTSALPFLSCESGSSGHRFRLFLSHRPADEAAPGAFNAYGLSSTATVPWF